MMTEFLFWGKLSLLDIISSLYHSYFLYVIFKMFDRISHLWVEMAQYESACWSPSHGEFLPVPLIAFLTIFSMSLKTSGSSMVGVIL